MKLRPRPPRAASPVGRRLGPGAVLLCLAVAVGACGSERLPGGGSPATAEDAIARQWMAGQQLGYALLSHQRQVPLTLGPERCTVDGQLAVAVADASLAASDAEGLCIVTDDLGWVGHEAELTPTCAGTMAFLVGGATQRNVVCGDTFTDPVEIDCAELLLASGAQVLSPPSELDGDLLGALDLSVMRPGAPLITTPAPQGDGTALWGPDGDLRVSWSGGSSGAVELLLGRVSGVGPQVRCLAADTGSFTLPGRLLAPYRGGRAFLEVALIRQAGASPDGFEFRFSFRESDAIWLFPAPGG